MGTGCPCKNTDNDITPIYFFYFIFIQIMDGKKVVKSLILFKQVSLYNPPPYQTKQLAQYSGHKKKRLSSACTISSIGSYAGTACLCVNLQSNNPMNNKTQTSIDTLNYFILYLFQDFY